MADAKIEIKVGAVSFSGEGEGKWLSEQLDKLLEKIPELAQVVPAAPDPGAGGSGAGTPAGGRATGTLASFLRTKNAERQQVRKFLATAAWLHDRDKKSRLTTRDVTAALSQNNQTKLNNPADCLNKNVAKGSCEKAGKEFFVTEDGRKELQ